MRLSNDTAAIFYERRHQRSPDVDARWGTWWAAMSQLRARLVRGVVNRDRARNGGRLLDELDALPEWATAALGGVAQYRGTAIVDGVAWLEMMADPHIGAAADALAAGAPAADAIAQLGDQWTVDLFMLHVAKRELDEVSESRARDDTMRAFYQGVRLWFRSQKYQPPSPTPSQMMLLAAASRVEPIVGNPEHWRRRWEKRVSRWNKEPYADPFEKEIHLSSR